MKPSGVPARAAAWRSVRVGDQYSGSQPSAMRAVWATLRGPSAPSSTGSPGRSGCVMDRSGLPSPVAPGPAYGRGWWRPSSTTGASRRSTCRTTSTYSRVAVSGLSGNGRPYHPSTTCGPDSPSPSSIRPPERWSSVRACMAVAVGERAAICATAVPSRMRRVWAAIHVSGVKASEPQDSAVHTEW